MTPSTSDPRQPAGANLAGPGTVPAVAAFVIGMLYAAVSAYWGLGGTGLLDTVGGTLEREGRAGAGGVRLLLWMAVLLKVNGTPSCGIHGSWSGACYSPRRSPARARTLASKL
jgi:hypothetical protein